MIREYSFQDYETINVWFKKRNGVGIPMESLSNIGFIVPGVAAGFLVTTNVNCCFFEPFIANPDTTPTERDTALREILNKLEDASRSMGIKYTYGLATSQTMIKRAMDNNWLDLGNHTLVVKENR